MKVVMKEKGVKKKGGCSWIEVSNRFHIYALQIPSLHKHLKIYEPLGSHRRDMVKKEYKFDFVEAFLSY
ncbi:hypothetical protein LINGRAPRIM_LOCUS268 [Linum grandiflorum]